MSRNSAESDALARGIQRVRSLPDPELGALWDSIIFAEDFKQRLVSQAALNFTLRAKVSRTVLPLHGIILLVGPPGTGKTSLARGLAHRTATLFGSSSFQLLEIEPHTLNSSSMGKTQRATSELFSQSIAEAATAGPTIVLLDEVETLAVDRSKLSLEANPVDIHRATDAVLVQLDLLAEQYPQLLFLATSNFPEAVDSAFVSRCDLVVEVPLPNEAACCEILTHCLSGLADSFPAVGKLVKGHGFAACVTECVGLDGRTIRKVVANALALKPQTALDPEKLTLEDIKVAAHAAKLSRKLRPKS